MKVPSFTLSVTMLLLMGCVPGNQPAAPPTEQLASVKADNFATAIKVPHRSSFEGIRWEYEWVAKNRPGWVVEGQALAENGSRTYDILTLRKGTQTEDIFFDITSFFGK